MKLSVKILIGAAVLLLIITAALSFYIVEEDEHALVLRFSKVEHIVSEAGLHFKIPFIDTIKTYCFECPEYPCRLIKNLEKSYNKRYQASLMENSEFVCQHGLEIFMEQQKEKYTCPKCGGIISIHDRKCSECQEKLK